MAGFSLISKALTRTVGFWLLAFHLHLAADNILPTDALLKNVSLPLYSSSSTGPVAVLRVERVFRDYQKKGFFRIGALPVLVAQGVTLDLLGPFESGGSVDFPILQGMENAEFRKVELRLASESETVLEAGKMSMEKGGRFLFSDGVTFKNTAHTIKGRRGQLHISPTGLIAINITLAGVHAAETNLFHQLPHKTPTANHKVNEN